MPQIPFWRENRMKIIRPENWVPCDGIKLENDAETAVRCSDNHVLVIAGPGAGKTELLSQKAAYLLQTNQCKDPQKILAICFKTDAAQNLKQRVETRCGVDAKHRFVSMTYDAFAKSLLDHFLFALPNELRPSPDYLVNDQDTIDAAFREAGYKNRDGLKPFELNNYYQRELQLVALPISGSEIRHKAWSYLIKGFNGYKSTLSFQMIMKLAMYILHTNPHIKSALQMTYSHVFLDEFQDTTSLQYEFVKECFFNSNTRITAVGDNKQCIMRWAGALTRIFKMFDDELHPTRARLVMNHRSAPKLIALQKAMYASLNERKTEVHVSEKWDSNDGYLSLLIADNEFLEATFVSDDIVQRIQSGLKPNDICILCKQRPDKYVQSIITQLSKQGIRARIETEYQDLVKDPVIDLVLKVLLCSQNQKHPQEWISIEDELIDLWGINDAQNSDAYDQMKVRLSELTSSINKSIQHGVTREQWSLLLDQILAFFDIRKLRSKYPAIRQGNYLSGIISKFEALFWNELLNATGNWSQAIANFTGENSIPIMTIHKSKGLEYSAVYFLGLEDSAFWSFRSQPEEDRCAFFVALSRAKESLVFTFCKKRTTLLYQDQRHYNINEFFVLLQQPGMANVITVTERTKK